MLPLYAARTNDGLIHRITDLKEFKKFVKTHTNVLVIFSQTGKMLKLRRILLSAGDSDFNVLWMNFK